MRMCYAQRFVLAQLFQLLTKQVILREFLAQFCQVTPGLLFLVVPQGGDREKNLVR
jgi:hypothetical protein